MQTAAGEQTRNYAALLVQQKATALKVRYDVSVYASCVESVGIHAHMQLSSYCLH